MRIVTNVYGLERAAAPGVIVVSYSPRTSSKRITRNLRLLLTAVRSEHLVIDFSAVDLIFFSALLWLIPFHRCRITTIDFFAGETPAWVSSLLGWSLRRVARCLVYFRDSSLVEKKFGMCASQFRYVPFKINALEEIREATLRDAGYIFSGGRSRRDFATFFEAVNGTGYPIKLLIGDEAELAPNGSSLDGLRIPANVDVLRKNASARDFAHLLAGAKMVVIPVLPGIVTQAGIGVYLQAMAAHKCVIVSSGPGVSDVLTGNQAIVVPAGDAAALRDAIRRAWEDAELRECYAEAGARYALPLGGEDELRRSIMNGLP